MSSNSVCNHTCDLKRVWHTVIYGNFVNSFSGTDAAPSHTKTEESIHTLERTKDELLKQRELLEQKLHEGSLLDPKEERR